MKIIPRPGVKIFYLTLLYMGYFMKMSWNKSTSTSGWARTSWVITHLKKEEKDRH